MPPERLSAALVDRYRIERELGQGGMATVYLAEDLKHKRKVAVKVLKPELAAVLGAERFVAEITTTAALQHPHILPLFDSGTADGFLYYVMPFIDGETLRSKLDRETQFGVDEAVRIASQVADALDYAHRHGVVHRDIKPENILLHEGRPMVADFGIALAVSAAAGGRMTETGLSLGTPHYMSPEQATAEKEISGRSDVYSLASVLYEMLAGQPPHLGGSAQQIIMKIIAEQPATVTTLRKSVPANVAAAVAKALEKLPADRFASAREFAQALGDASFRHGDMGQAAGVARAGGHSAFVSRALAAALLFLAGGALGAWITQRARSARDDDAGGVVRFAMPLPGEASGDAHLAGKRSIALSPDGRSIAVIGRIAGGSTQLFVREMSGLEWKAVPGTEGATNPFFSPDGASIAFVVSQNLVSMPTAGGTLTQLAPVGEDAGVGSWGPAGRIVISIGSRLATLAETGGVPRFVPSADSGFAQLGQLSPMALDDGVHAVFSRNNGSEWELCVISLESGEVAMLGVRGYAIGLVDGVLIFGARYSGGISGVRLDVATHRAVGDPVALASTGLGRSGNTADGVLSAVSRSGALVHVSGRSREELVQRDLSGGTRVLWPDANAGHPRFSPDGQRIVLQVNRDLWLLDRAPGAVPQRLTSDSASDRPEWTADGRRILYRSRTGARGTLVVRPADGSGAAMLLLGMPDLEVWQGMLSPDERTLVYRTGTVNGADIWYRSLTGDTTDRPVATTPSVEIAPRFSPDGRWIAYVSNESDVREVYVRAFPISASPTRVSVDGAQEPIWARDGRSLFYRNAKGIVRAAIRTVPTFTVVSREVVLTDYDGEDGISGFDVAPNGREIVMNRTVTEGAQLLVVSGWKHELRDRFAKGTP